MKAIAKLVESGQLRARIADTFPLGGAAHAAGEMGHTAGKLVLVVDGEALQ